MKVWALYKENSGNYKKITAFEVLHKERAAPGRWKSRTYFSTHQPDKRLPMHHRHKNNGTCSFVYNRKHVKQAERLGGGESLAHYLFKTAINELTSSKLKTGYHHPGVKIGFKNMRTEKEIVHNGKSYFIDVFGEFESSSRLQLKWGALLGIEVCHSNPVEKEKIEAFRALELPVVQIRISDKLVYRTPEHLSTPDKEKKYLEFLKTALTDYMGVEILSNPSTKEYLQEENSSLKSKLNELEEQLGSEKQRCADLKRRNEALSKEFEDSAHHMLQLSEQARKAEEKLDGLKNLSLMRFFIKKRRGW